MSGVSSGAARLREAQQNPPYLQCAHVPKHHVTDPLAVALDMSVGAPLPEETLKDGVEGGV